MMKRYLYIVSFLFTLLLSGDIFAQCSGGTLKAAITPTTSWQTYVNIYGGYYLTFNATSGITYTFSFCQGGGSASFDTQLTILDNSGAYAGGYNDDFCSLQSELAWTAPSTATYRILVSQYNCTTNATYCTLAYKCTAPPCTTPGIPTAITGSATGQTTANLSWTANGGSATVTYHWYVGTASPVGPCSSPTVLTNPSSPWAVPAGVTTMTVYVYGAGGGSGGCNNSSSDQAGGGGGGGACAIQTITVAGGQTYNITVGTGGTLGASGGGGGGAGGLSEITGPGGTVIANGGNGGGGSSNGVAGSAGAGATTGSGYSSIYSGGNGTVGVRNTSVEVGGGGGGGAGNAGAGANGTAGTTGGANSTGGAGGAGTPVNGSPYKGGAGSGATNSGGTIAGVAGNAPGGGAAGASSYNANAAGAAGGNGQVIIVYTPGTIIDQGTTTSTTATTSALTCNSTYYLSVYATTSCDGTSSACGTSSAFTTSSCCVAPTTQASSITFSNVQCTQMDVNWINGNGSKRIVVVKSGSAVTGTPSNNTTYTANTVFGSGSILNAGEYVVFNGSGGGPVTVTGLSSSTTYYFMVYEYNCAAGAEQYYLTSPPSNSQATQTPSTPYAGPDQYICSSLGIATMAATGTGTWSYISGPAGYSITLPSSPITTIIGLTAGTYEFRWNANCGGVYDDVMIVVQ